jgi:response regulator RpfG family c-di-GMP phosphodiesterase
MAQDILIVDDMPEILDLYGRILSRIDDVKTHRFESPLLALLWAWENEPDLLIVDYEMPEMNGVELVARFRRRHASGRVPIMMVTSRDDKNLRYLALDLGVDEYLSKPVDTIEFLKRVRNLLRWRDQSWARLGTYDKQVMHQLTRVNEFREHETRNHFVRIGHYARLLARATGRSQHEQDLLFLAVPLLDIGKVGIPDQILLKNGALTTEEFETIKTHAHVGHEILKGSDSPLLHLAAEIARSHHERYDGSGYPDGLKGDEIPISARIGAIVDVFDALLSERPYKPAWPLADVLPALKEGSRNGQFDPLLHDAFLDIMPAIEEIRLEFSG